MKRSIAVLLASLFLVTFAACRSREKKISNELQSKGSTEVVKEAAKDKYDPPADGHLTDSQIDMYIKVRKHERDIALQARKELEEHAKKVQQKGENSVGGMMEAMKGMGSVADFATADIRAAQDLGYNTAEYTWIKGKVLEASGSALSDNIHSKMEQGIKQAYEATKKQYDAAQDPNQKKALGQLLQNYQQQLASLKPEQVDPAVAYNRQLLSKHEDALKAITMELSKYEDKSGQAEDQLQRALENTSTQGSETAPQ